jgi:hypothetical protein
MQRFLIFRNSSLTSLTLLNSSTITLVRLLRRRNLKQLLSFLNSLASSNFNFKKKTHKPSRPKYKQMVKILMIYFNWYRKMIIQLILCQ